MAIQRTDFCHGPAGGVDLTDSDGDWLSVLGRNEGVEDGANFIGIPRDKSTGNGIVVTVPMEQLVTLNSRIRDFVAHQAFGRPGQAHGSGNRWPVPAAFAHQDFQGDTITVVSRHNRITGGAFFILARPDPFRVVTVTVTVDDLKVVHDKINGIISYYQEDSK